MPSAWLLNGILVFLIGFFTWLFFTKCHNMFDDHWVPNALKSLYRWVKRKLRKGEDAALDDTADEEEASINEALEFIRRGSKLTKVRPSGKFTRFFHYDASQFTLDYQGGRKGSCVTGKTGYDLSTVNEVRIGHKTDVFNNGKVAKYFEEASCFSLIVGPKNESLDLACEDQKSRDLWVRGIKAAISRQKNQSIQKQQDQWIRDLFQQADADKDGSLSLAEIEKLLPKMNITIKKQVLKEMFDGIRKRDSDSRSDSISSVESADSNKVKNGKGLDALELEEFVTFVHMLQKRPELEAIFEDYSDDGYYLTMGDIRDFLQHEQSQPQTSDKDLKRIIDTYEPSPSVREHNMLSLDGFQAFMTYDQLIIDPEKQRVYQDMRRPMNEYFIASSHNTYIMEGQLRGPSSTEAYIRALETGCRCVELDCWDGPNNEPIVYHGHTLVSKILFKDVVKIINEYAFKISDYPLILSIENHCSIEQQKVMARYFEEILGDCLYKTPAPDSEVRLPSPEDLKGKILIKGKKLKSTAEEGDVSDEDEAADIEDEEVKKDVTEKKKKDKKQKLAPELSNLVVYVKSVGFKGFEYAIENYTYYEMSSLVENKTKKLFAADPAGFAHYNKFFNVRIYPDGLRTDSSNYDPMDPWSAGCTIVALNYQTPGKPMQLNFGKFRENGQSGYVLKPDFLRDPQMKFNPMGPFPPELKRTLTVKVISAYQLPKAKEISQDSKDISDPFVRVKVYGVPADRLKEKTKTVKDNGFNPRWDEEFKFSINVPQLALVRFVVKDSNLMSVGNLAHAVIPFNCLRKGYRHVSLYKKYGQLDKKAVLFVHIDIS